MQVRYAYRNAVPSLVRLVLRELLGQQHGYFLYIYSKSTRVSTAEQLTKDKDIIHKIQDIPKVRNTCIYDHVRYVHIITPHLKLKVEIVDNLHASLSPRVPVVLLREVVTGADRNRHTLGALCQQTKKQKKHTAVRSVSTRTRSTQQGYKNKKMGPKKVGNDRYVHNASVLQYK